MLEGEEGEEGEGFLFAMFSSALNLNLSSPPTHTGLDQCG